MIGAASLNTDYISAAISEVIAPTEGTSVAPAWRRCVAYVVDSVLLGLAFSYIGRLFYGRISQLGLWGISIGFALGALYFASMDSKIGNGQTVGKRLMKLRLVDRHGQTTSLERAFARYTIFVVPVLLYGWRTPLTKTPSIASDLIFILVYWVGGSSVYLMLFERLNRQGLHDLAVGTFAVYADHEGPIETRAMPQLHWALLASLLLAITIGAAGLKNWSERQPVQMEFRHDSSLIESMDGVERAFLRDRLTHMSNGVATKVLYINIVRKTKPASEEDFARTVVKRLSNSDPFIQSYDSVTVRIYYGYDIGFGSRWDHREFEKKPKEWVATDGQ